jgi:hypothetical protein
MAAKSNVFALPQLTLWFPVLSSIRRAVDCSGQGHSALMPVNAREEAEGPEQATARRMGVSNALA